MSTKSTTKSTKSTKAETISANFEGHGRQTVTYRETLDLGGQKLRIIIKSDSYIFQCGARIERWDGTQWHEVHHLVPSRMETKVVGASSISAETFAADRALLVALAREIVA